MSELRRGDRVKVTIEAEVLCVSSRLVDVIHRGSDYTFLREAVEKIASPLPVFYGSLVRSSGLLHVYTRNGWLNVAQGIPVPTEELQLRGWELVFDAKGAK